MDRLSLQSVKISPPVLPGIFKRTRLYKILNQSLKRPVLWVSGLPGAGKTTLAASYIASKKVSSLWYQLDPGDEDAATFFHYLSLAAKKATPRKRSPLPRLAPEHLHNLQVFARRYFQHLFRRLTPPFILVFDNYQEIPVASQFHELIRIGLEQIPPGGNAIFLSRSEPPPPLLRLRLNGAMRTLKSDALRLTAEEATGIARLREGWASRPDAIRRLHKASEGWAAALVLMLEYDPSDHVEHASDDIERAPQEMAQETFFSYFAGEIFDRLDPVTQTFLLKTAFLPNITLETARRLTGLPEAGRILATMNRRLVFTDKKLPGSALYQYHPLFREFLLWRGEETFRPEQRRELNRQAADLLAEKGQVEEAVDLYQKSQSWPELARLICEEAPSLLKQGRFRTLKEWLERLPEAMRLAEPWLLFWTGTCRLPFKPIESHAHFTQSFQAFKKTEDQVGMLLAASSAMEAILTEWGDFKPLDRWIALFDSLPKGSTANLPDNVGARVAFAMFAALMFRQPDHPEMRYWANRVLQCMRSDIDVAQRILIGGYLAHYRFWVGDVQAAGLILDQVRQLARTVELPPLIFAIWKMQEAVYYWHTAAFETCLKTVAEGLTGSEESGIHLLDSWLLAQAVYASLSRGDLAGAASFLDQMKPVLDGNRHLDISHYHYLSSWYHLLSDHLERALQHAQIALQINKEVVGTPVPEGLVSIMLAQICHESGEGEKAVPLLVRAREIALAMRSDVLLMLADLTQAYFSLELDQEDQALVSLKRGLALAKKQSVVNMAGWRPSMMTRLCIKALEVGIEVAYVQSLICKRSLLPQTLPLNIKNWPWTIKIFTLGRFSIVMDGKPHRLGGKTQHKPVALLKMLIAFGGRSVSRDHLADLLWPESEADQSERAFDTTLHRLRRLLMVEQAIQMKDRKLTLDIRHCWVDAWALERLLGQCGALLAQGDAAKEEISCLSESILRLYRGSFLADEAEWAVASRERLRSRFLRKIGLLGKMWEAAGEWEQAADCYLRAIEVDGVAEEIYRHLMICYQKQGRRAEALATYAHCRHMLKTILWIEPSQETQEIREQL